MNIETSIPERNSSITTVLPAAPNLPPSMFLSSTLACSRLWHISTPFPAARPSALSTYGAFRVERKSSASCNVSEVKLRKAAVGMECLCMKFLAKSLLPSRAAPFEQGPMNSTFSRSLSWAKKSPRPFTSGSSGPTTTISMPCSRTADFTAWKSEGLPLIFCPRRAVPGFPGMAYRFSQSLLLLIFHAIACSRPPPPNTNTFITYNSILAL